MLRYIKRYRVVIIILVLIISVKVGWVAWSCWNNGSFVDEKDDLLQRRNYLVEKIVVDPRQLLQEMPEGIGMQFQGEWALYSCSMMAEALARMSELYPETKDEAIAAIDSLIQIVKSPELRNYDKIRWGEDPLESLEGDESHVSYLSHLAWMIGNYRRVGGDERYNHLHDSICETMNRRILKSPILNIPTYPGEPIYIPDMLVAIIALSDYGCLCNGKYTSTVKRWINRAQAEWTDGATGILASVVHDDGTIDSAIKGSYTALSCYYLTKIDKDMAKDQYERLKKYFYQKWPVTGIKEYHDHSCWLGMDIDAGPIILNLSPSGTAFAIGCATYFGDKKFRNKLLKTAEIAGHSVKWNDCRHYLLANFAIVGEAIVLAMRTNHPESDVLSELLFKRID